jgi:hypothetical protein
MNGWPSEAQAAAYAPYDAETAASLKRAFASAIQRLGDPYGAARAIEPTGHPGRIAWIVDNWYEAPEIQQIVLERNAKLGIASKLPNKEEFAATVFKEAGEIKDNKTRLEYYRTVAEVMGFIEKGKGANNTNVNVTALPSIIRIVPGNARVP